MLESVLLSSKKVTLTSEFTILQTNTQLPLDFHLHSCKEMGGYFKQICYDNSRIIET